MIVLLDSGPLGLATQPVGGTDARLASIWLESLLREGMIVAIPEIADFEVRRELIRARKALGIEKLDRLAHQLTYLPISTPVMRRAAELWARARQQGRPTADRHALDADMIVSAQANVAADAMGDSVVVATTNVGHLSQFADARRWQDIQP
jgi:predicted nucleic acid-binding protein